MKALLVDGYNLIHSHPGLSSLLGRDPDAAREGLLGELRPLASPRFYDVVLVVFDAAGSSRNKPVTEDREGVTVVFTRRRQSADSFIETAVRHLSPANEVVVATSDRLLLSLVGGFGAGGVNGEVLLRMAREALVETREEIERVSGRRRVPLEDRVSEEVRVLLDRMRYQ